MLKKQKQIARFAKQSALQKLFSKFLCCNNGLTAAVEHSGARLGE